MLTTTVLIAILPLLASASPLASRNNNGKNQKTGLNGLAARTGRYFGTATNSFNIQGLTPGGPYNDVLDYEFAGALTAENEGKWEVIHPQENVYNFTGMDIVSQVRCLVPLSWSLTVSFVPFVLQPPYSTFSTSRNGPQIVEDAKRIGALVRGHTFVWHQQVRRDDDERFCVPFELTFL
jgi:GH35 family endo-1,4-beta-xylanase